MARPKCCRKIGEVPDINYYKPKGIPASFLEEVVLSLDEFEAIRLADCEGLYQEQAANNMNISRQTFGRIIDSARGKIADALIHGKALKIEGGNVELGKSKRLKCRTCNAFFDCSESATKPVCPHCKKNNSGCKNLSKGEKV
jgi:predicted DNA-binding protein (UPF0251 family)